MWDRVLLKARGKDAFRRNYGSAVAVAFIMGLISMVMSGNSSASNAGKLTPNITYHVEEGYHMSGFSMFGALVGMFFVVSAIALMLLKVFIEYNLRVGGAKFFIQNQISRPGVDMILDGFRSGHYGNIVLTMFLRDLYIALWTLLFIVPGIVKSYEYMMVPYILAENPGMDQKEVFQISREMMNGQKLNAFVLDLSFLGWEILSVCTCGLLGIFYVNPYIEATHAEVYAFNKQKAFESGYIR
ncbi:MAG: DUF975 family protein [bacterium]|nr:DUF975 family protein [bacterium]